MLETIHCGNIVCMLVCTNLPLFLSPNLLMQGRIWILNSKTVTYFAIFNVVRSELEQKKRLLCFIVTHYFPLCMPLFP